MDRVKLKPGYYYLEREGDGAGDSGLKLIPVDREDYAKEVGENGEIIVGYAVECGSITARTFSAQDFWLTAPVTEILEVSEDRSYARFKTRNSIYVVRSR